MARTKRSAAPGTLIGNSQRDENYDGAGDANDGDDQSPAPPAPKRTRLHAQPSASFEKRMPNATFGSPQQFESNSIDECVQLPKEWQDALRRLDPDQVVDLSAAPTFPNHAHNLPDPIPLGSVAELNARGSNEDALQDVLPTPHDGYAFLFDELVDLPYYVPLPSSLHRYLDNDTDIYSGDPRAALTIVTKCLLQPVLLADRAVINPHSCMYHYDTSDIRADSVPVYEPVEYAMPPTAKQSSVDSLTAVSFHEVQFQTEYYQLTGKLRLRHPSEPVNRKTGKVVIRPERNMRIVLRTVWLLPQAWDADKLKFEETPVTVAKTVSPLRDSIRPAMLRYLHIVLHPVPGCTYAHPEKVSTNGPGKTFRYRWSVWLRMDEVHKDLVAEGNGAAKETIRELLVSLSNACGWTSSLSACLESLTCQIPSVVEAAATLSTAVPYLDPFVFDDDHQLDPVQLACASWLIQQEQTHPRAISVIPSNTHVHTKLVRLGPDGYLFDPLSHHILRPDPSPLAPTNPMLPISITCADLLIKAPASEASSVILPMLALVHTNQLQRPHPIPAHLLPSRATLVVCHPMVLFEWELAARRIFQNPDQVLVMDSRADFERTTLHQVLAADLVLVSDTFLMADYDHYLHRVAGLMGTSHVTSNRQYLWCSGSAHRSYLQPCTALHPAVTRHNNSNKRGGTPGNRTAWITAAEDNERTLAHLAHTPVGVTSTDHEHDYQAMLTESRGDNDSDSEVMQTAKDHVRRRGKFHVPIEERLAEHKARMSPEEVCPLLHLVHWHRIVFDGPTRASERGGVLDRMGLDKGIFRHATPFRELCGSSTVTVVHSSEQDRDEEINLRAGYQMLNINPNDAPPPDLAVRAQHDLLKQLAVHMPSPSTRPPAGTSQPAGSAHSIVPVYLTGEESLRAPILMAMCGGSIPLTIAAVQHHLTPFSTSPSDVYAARHNDCIVSLYHPANRMHTGTSTRWAQLNRLVARRRAHARPAYDGFVYVGRGPRTVDRWRQGREQPEVNMAALLDGNAFGADPLGAEDQTVALVRGTLTQSTNRVLPSMLSSKTDDNLTWMRAGTVAARTAVQNKLHQVRQTLQVLGRQQVPQSIARALVERGLAVDHIKLMQVRLSNEEMAELRNKGEEVVRGMPAGKKPSALRVVHASYDPDEAGPRHADSPDVVPWYQQLISLAKMGRLLVSALQSLRLLEQASLLIDWWGKLGSFVDICVQLKQGDSVTADTLVQTHLVCQTCQQYLDSNGDTVFWFACKSRGCSACKREHLSQCDLCAGIDDALPAPVHFKFHPFARYQVEQEWTRLLGSFELADRVRDHCNIQEWLYEQSTISDHDKLKGTVCFSSVATSSWHESAFTRCFGAKVQAIAMYILQQLERNPLAKFVVLSEYMSQQHLLGLALDLLRVRTELVLHAASEYTPMRAFKTDPNVRVLIIPFTKCLPGRVHLTEATHVLLAHPFVGTSPELNEEKNDVRYLGPVTATLERMAQEVSDLERWRAIEEKCLQCIVGVDGATAGDVKVVRFAIEDTREAELVGR